MLKENFCLAIPKNHKLVSLDEIDLYELRDEPFISLTSDLPLYTSTLQLCKQAGFIPKINLESNNPSIMIDFIKRGMGIAIIPEKTWRIFKYPDGYSENIMFHHDNSGIILVI